MKIHLIEDQQVEQLYPVTIGRPAYAVTIAGYRLVDWLRLLELPMQASVRPHLLPQQSAEFTDLTTAAGNGKGSLQLLVNARLVPSHSNFRALQQIVAQEKPVIAVTDGVVAAALLTSSVTLPAKVDGFHDMQTLVEHDKIVSLPRWEQTLSLLSYPHDVIAHNGSCFAENLSHRLEQGNYEEIEDGVFVAPGAKLGEYTITDTSEGPILLDRNASVGPHCFLSGPAYLGHGSRVIEHSAIKDAVTLGHTTKIGGEVEASVIEPYTNKQHHGFLGHSYLGSWINLGAGTCNSDLKNTYGAVKMSYRGKKVDTGMQFVGCIMGDYAKTAINTGIFTGKTIGACSMVYGFVSTNVPSFVNYARTFGQVTELSPDVMIATQRRMFLRRNVAQRPPDEQLIRDMYELTRHERQLADEPLSL